MMIIMAVFAIAMGIIANVQRLSLSAKKIHAQSVLKEELLQIERSLRISKESLTVGDFRIEKEVSIYNNNSALFEISLTAYDLNEQKIGELKEVVCENK